LIIFFFFPLLPSVIGVARILAGRLHS